MANHLAEEKSPYLLQHAENPVNWYPWNQEALSRARREGKPILVSIGYSACHWCHVMAHESFEDKTIAKIMNDHFVNIKVDREERPDVDSVYMEAVQALTGQGGWPLNVFLTPDGKPFFGGTYFPPIPRHGLPSWPQVLQSVADAFRERPDDIARNATTLSDYVRRAQKVEESETDLTDNVLRNALERSASTFDWNNGGFGTAPKFPQPLSVELLLRLWRRYGDDKVLRFVRLTLDHMAAGGIFDHLGGGFHRYTVDGSWVVPHFEKMLYDNALLATAYLHAYQVTKDQRYRAVVEATLDYLLRDMRSVEGGFYSAEDADSEGTEGKFYIWSMEDLLQALSPDAAILAATRYGVRPGGNFEGKTILTDTLGVEQIAQQTATSIERVTRESENIRATLLAARETRVRPGKDTKILASWNALAITALAEAGRALGREDYLVAAQLAMQFILVNLRPEGRLVRSYNDGPSAIPGFLEDHAFVLEALLTLHQACSESGYLEESRNLAAEMIALFWEPTQGSFFDTQEASDDLFVRPRSLFDNPIPSGSSAAVSSLLTLQALTGDTQYQTQIVATFRSAGALLERAPLGFSRLLSALDTYLSPHVQVAIAGDPARADTMALVAAAFTHYRPHTVVVFGEPDSSPLLAQRTLVAGNATAYVCRNLACRLPITDTDEFLLELEQMESHAVARVTE